MERMRDNGTTKNKISSNKLYFIFSANRIKIKRKGGDLMHERTKKNKGKVKIALLSSVVLLSGNPIFANAESSTITFSESINSTQVKRVSLPSNAYVQSIRTDNGNVSYQQNGTNLDVTVSNGSSHRSVYNPYKYSKYIQTSRSQYGDSFPNSIPYSDWDGYTGSYSKVGGANLVSGNIYYGDTKRVTLTRSTSPGQSNYLPSSLTYQNEPEGQYSGYTGTLSTLKTDTYGSLSGKKTVTQNSEQDLPRTKTPSSHFDASIPYNDGVYSGRLYQDEWVPTSKWSEYSGYSQFVQTFREDTKLYPPPNRSGTGEWDRDWSTYMHKVQFEVWRNNRWSIESDGVDYFLSLVTHDISKWTRGWYSNNRGGDPIMPWVPSSWSGRNYHFTQMADKAAEQGRSYVRFSGGTAVTDRNFANHWDAQYKWFYSKGYMKYSGEVTKPNDQYFVRTYQGDVTKPTIDDRYYTQYYDGQAYKPGYDDYYRYNVTFDYIIDNELPDFNLSANPTAFTNQNVTITANNVKDTGDSGLRGIQLPNGTWVNSETVPYIVSTNGTYTFRAEDNVGNATTKSISVTNIDKNAPTATLTQSPTAWTKGNVILTLSNIADTGVSGLKEIVMPDGKKETTFTDKTFEVTERGTYTFQIVDNAGNVTNKTITVSNIDREAPEAELTKNPNGFTNTDVTIQVRNVRDIGTSGMKSLMLPNGQFVTPGNRDYVVSDNGQYAFKMEDNAGNETVKTIDVNNIDRIKPSANFSLSTTEATRDDVLVYIKDIQDEGVSGLKHVKYPDGSLDTTFEDKAYPLKKNGTYTFEVSDNAGNTIQHTVTVINIDQEPPTADVIKTPDMFTKNPVEVRIHNIRDIGFAGLKSVTHPDGTVTKDEEIIYIVNKNDVREFILEDNIGNTRVLKVNVTNIDNDKPEADMRMSTESMTNQDVVLHLENLRDVGTSGLKSVTLPNGTVKTTFEDIAYTVSSNNAYTFILEDKAGNVTEKVFDVKNIDKLAPTADISQTPTSFTNKDVTLKLSNIQDTGVSRLKAITLPNGQKVTTFEDHLYDVPANGTYQFVIEDHAGNKTTKTITVGNIDKVSPTASLSQTPTTLTNSNVTLILSSVNDTGVSGLESIKLPNGSIIAPTTTTSVAVATNGTYQFVIRDKAGNETVKEIVVNNIDKSVPTATLRASTTEFTNQDVTLYLENIQDVGVGGMKSVVLPNGEMTFSFEDKSYIVTQNGTYTFTLEDNARNVTMKTITVNNIDKENPLADIDYSPKAINKGPVQISLLNVADEGVSGIHEVKLPNGTMVPAQPTVNYNVFDNGEYSMTLYDKAGNSIVRTVTIANIDNQMPDADIVWSKGWTNNSVVISLTNFRDEGIAGYDSVRLPNGVSVSGSSTSYIVTENGDYPFVVRDRVGNERTKVAQIRNIDKGKPIITFTEKEKTSSKVKMNVFIKDGNKKR